MSKFSLALHMKAYLHHPYSITLIGIGSWLGLYVVFMVTDHVPSYESIFPLSIFNHTYWYWVLACVICCFYGDCPMPMYHHMKAYIHHPYSITHNGIGSWLGSYVVFMVTAQCPCTVIWNQTSIIHTPSHILVLGLGLGHMLFFLMTDNVPSYESKHSSSILHKAYWYWVLDRVICCFYGDCPCTAIWNQTSILHTASRI